MPGFNKKIFLPVATLVTFFSPALALALTEEPLSESAGSLRDKVMTNLNRSGEKAGTLQSLSIYDIIGGLIGFSLTVVGIIFLVEALRGGYDWMTAAGNDTQVKNGKDRLVNGAIGIVIIFGAYMLVSFITGKVGGIIGIPGATP